MRDPVTALSQKQNDEQLQKDDLLMMKTSPGHKKHVS